jgi:hypothetical protein
MKRKVYITGSGMTDLYGQTKGKIIAHFGKTSRGIKTF